MPLRPTALLLTVLCLPVTTACPGKKAKKADGQADRKEAAKADTHEADTKKEIAKETAPAPVNAPPKPKFRKGRPPRPGLSNEELKEYAKFQGDPEEGDFTLEEAFAGDDTLASKDHGKLKAVFDTTMGKFECNLFEDDTPLTIANFVGLARGTRASYNKKADTWEKKKFFDGVKFHRVIPNFMVQTGDPTGSGTGGPGYFIQDEIDTKKLKHNKAGILSMANRGKNTGSSQFFVTVRATPHLDGKHTVFGQCKPKVAVKISKVKADSRFNKPVEDVKINTIKILRKKK